MAICVGGNSLHKFECAIPARGSTEEMWKMERVGLRLWHFSCAKLLPSPIRYEIYEKQPVVLLQVERELVLEESSRIEIPARLVYEEESIVKCSLIKLSVAIYYSVDVGFQENEYVLSCQDQFMGLDFATNHNLLLCEGEQEKVGQGERVQALGKGSLRLEMRRFKVHRKHISRIEFNLEFIRGSASKYQSAKHYTSKCTLVQSLRCAFEGIHSPTLLHLRQLDIDPNSVNPSFEGMQSQPIQSIVEEECLLQVRISKQPNDLTPFKVWDRNKKEYLLSNHSSVVV